MRRQFQLLAVLCCVGQLYGQFFTEGQVPTEQAVLPPAVNGANQHPTKPFPSVAEALQGSPVQCLRGAFGEGSSQKPEHSHFSQVGASCCLYVLAYHAWISLTWCTLCSCQMLHLPAHVLLLISSQQVGEDGILEGIFGCIGVTPARSFIEFGVEVRCKCVFVDVRVGV